MSIVKLKRISLCGLSRHKEEVLDRLQALGCVHLIPLRDGSGDTEEFNDAQPADTYRALKFLHDCPRKRHQVSDDPQFSLRQCVGNTTRIQQALRTASDRRDFLLARIRSMEPWGDFAFPPEQTLGGYRLWFYVVPVGMMSKLPDDLVWQVVHRDTRFANVVVVAREEPATDAMPVARSHTGPYSLSELQGQFNEVELELEDLQAEREFMTRWIYMISRNLARAEDRAGLHGASEQTLDTGLLFAVQGWVDRNRVEALAAFADLHELALLVEDPGPEDAPPTLTENPEALRAGEGLVNFYQTPGYRDWDPSTPVLFSFTLFFAMIVSDAGYAALLGLPLLLYWRRIGRSRIGRSGRMLLAMLAASSVLWGILVGSYFGVSPPSGSLAGSLRLLDLNDFDTMMRVSVFIGVAHLSFANLNRAWRLHRQGRGGLVPLAWILVMFGALFIWLDQSLERAPEWVGATGRFKLLAGLGLVLVFSGQRRVRGPVDLLLRLLDGLRGLTDITRIFGDVLSYLRLFALGLASASLALTFNNLAADVRASVEGPGLLFSLLILVIGHGLNIVLSLMSAVVHGMRLNCIEFFNWGLSGDGYLFKAFSKKEISK